MSLGGLDVTPSVNTTELSYLIWGARVHRYEVQSETSVGANGTTHKTGDVRTVDQVGGTQEWVPDVRYLWREGT